MATKKEGKARAVHAAQDTDETLNAEQRAALEEARAFAGNAQPPVGALADFVADDREEGEEEFEEIGSRRPPTHRTRAMDSAQESVHPLANQPWVEPTNLAAPPARPGYVQRWIRIGHDHDPDAKNISRKFREGWTPRRADTVPASFFVQPVTKGRFEGCIIVEGMLLCEMPVDLNERRKAGIAARTDRLIEGIENDLLRTQQPGHPLFRAHKTKVTTGRRPVVAPDT